MGTEEEENPRNTIFTNTHVHNHLHTYIHKHNYAHIHKIINILIYSHNKFIDPIHTNAHICLLEYIHTLVHKHS